MPEEENDEELRPGQGSAYDLSCANTFNSVALPAGFERLNMNRLLGGNMRMDFSTNGIGGITELNGIKFGKDGEPEEEEDEKLEKFAEAVEKITQPYEVRSQEALDNMEWSIDPQTQMQFGGKTTSALSWYMAARQARQNLDKLAREQGWNTDKKAEQESALSKYSEALKKGDQAAANDAWSKMDRATREAVLKANHDQELFNQVRNPDSQEIISTLSTAEVYGNIKSGPDVSNLVSLESSSALDNENQGINTNVNVRNSFNMNASNEVPANPAAAPQQAAPQQLALNARLKVNHSL